MGINWAQPHRALDPVLLHHHVANAKVYLFDVAFRATRTPYHADSFSNILPNNKAHPPTPHCATVHPPLFLLHIRPFCTTPLPSVKHSLHNVLHHTYTVTGMLKRQRLFYHTNRPDKWSRIPCHASTAKPAALFKHWHTLATSGQWCAGRHAWLHVAAVVCRSVSNWLNTKPRASAIYSITG